VIPTAVLELFAGGDLASGLLPDFDQFGIGEGEQLGRFSPTRLGDGNFAPFLAEGVERSVPIG